MKRFTKITALLLAVLMALSLTACGSDKSDGSGSGAADKNITVGWTGTVEGFDPAWSNNGIGMSLIYETLFVNNPDTGALEGLLVDSYEWQDDTTLKLTLKEGITFSNGDPLEPSDILFSMKYYVDVGSNLSTYYNNYDWDNCQVLDGKTLVIKYFEPYGPALNYMTLCQIQNQSYYEEKGEDAFWDQPCGTGPYSVVENVSGSYSKYQLRDDYWGASKPQAQEITVKTYAEATTMYIDFENGALDMAFKLDAGDAQRATEASGSGAVAVIQSDLDTKMFNLASYKEEFQNPLVREAIAIGVDWTAVGEAAFGVLCEPATSTLPSLVRYHLDTPGYTFDPERAKELLAEAGYENGFTINFVLVNETSNNRMAEAIQGYLSAIGIDFQYQSFDIPTAIPMFMAGETDGIIKTAQGGATCLEPDQIYDTLKSSSTLVAAAVQDETFDSYLMDGLYTVDDAARKDLYEKAQTWLYENMWAIPICDTSACFVYKDNLSFNTVSVTYPNLRFVTFK